jgi:phenylpropionate dioxygenase-like ring-hydroxylating dioxygenase large terminal subunit
MTAIAHAPNPRTTFSDLVRGGKVHSDVYTSSAIFEREIEAIFHRSWLYVGHESEVPKSGDFKTRVLGRQPIIFLRGRDGAVRVLMNRCRHRGALVCETSSGNSEHFRCWYHGWTYDSTGALVHVPEEEGAYDVDFDRSALGLTSAPNVGSYRGFVFASLAADVPPLAQHLGLAAGHMDIMIDASPQGEIALDAGVQKTVYKGNWKFVGMDGYHPNVLHVSAMETAKRKSRGTEGGGSDVTGASRGDPWNDKSESLTRELGNGHAMLDLSPFRVAHAEEYLASLATQDGGREYIAAMNATYGPERATVLIANAADPHLGIYPNAQLVGNHVRIIHPIAVDQTEVLMFPVRIRGLSAAMNEARIRGHQLFYGPAGNGSPDDAEIFERLQQGLRANVDPWIDISRGLKRERKDDDGSTVGKITDEIPQRAQFRRWTELMDA